MKRRAAVVPVSEASQVRTRMNSKTASLHRAGDAITVLAAVGYFRLLLTDRLLLCAILAALLGPFRFQLYEIEKFTGDGSSMLQNKVGLLQ
jgi:hypothetical protein